MASSGAKEQFLRQMEQIVEGIKQSRIKVCYHSLSLPRSALSGFPPERLLGSVAAAIRGGPMRNTVADLWKYDDRITKYLQGPTSMQCYNLRGGLKTFHLTQKQRADSSHVFDVRCFVFIFPQSRPGGPSGL